MKRKFIQWWSSITPISTKQTIHMSTRLILTNILSYICIHIFTLVLEFYQNCLLLKNYTIIICCFTGEMPWMKFMLMQYLGSINMLLGTTQPGQRMTICTYRMSIVMVCIYINYWYLVIVFGLEENLFYNGHLEFCCSESKNDSHVFPSKTECYTILIDM